MKLMKMLDYEETYDIRFIYNKTYSSISTFTRKYKTIDEVGDIKIDQVVIGSCTNGRYRRY